MLRCRLSIFALYITYDIARLDVRCCRLSIFALYMTCDIARLEFVSNRVSIDSKHREILDTSARMSINSHMKFTYEYSTLRNNFRYVLLEIIPMLTNAFIYDSAHWYIDHVIWYNHVLWVILIIEYNNSTYSHNRYWEFDRWRDLSVRDVDYESALATTLSKIKWFSFSRVLVDRSSHTSRRVNNNNNAQYISIAATQNHQRNSFAHTHVTIYDRCRRSHRSHIIITCHTNKRTDWRDLNHRFEIVISHILFRRLTWDTRTQRRDIIARDIRSDRTM